MPDKIVVIYSGGMDSYTLLNDALDQGKRVYALSFNYGQKHAKELHYAQKVCDQLGLPHKVVDITSIHQLLMGSSLTDDIEIPDGHYEEESMKSTVVPNRKHGHAFPGDRLCSFGRCISCLVWSSWGAITLSILIAAPNLLKKWRQLRGWRITRWLMSWRPIFQ